MVRVRFAPSPTGYLHVGGLRTALYNYLFAKQHNGEIILRIEDTDQSRKVKDAVEQILDVFTKVNIQFDEGPKINEKVGPYFQSQRLGIYSSHIEKLIESGYAYHCFCTAERLDDLRKERQAKKESTKYDKKCLHLSSDEIELKKRKLPYVIRLNVEENSVIEFDDLVRGKVVFNTAEIDDQVLLKSDGFPTYHLANVVDDYLMGITHVIRGEEWLSSTPKHILLYNALGWDLPQFAHLPLLLNPDKSKLSKRQGDVAVEDYLDKGFLPEALLNFVAFLGWNPGDDCEFFTLDELTKTFSIERIQKGGAVFNQQKLQWINSHYLKSLQLEKIIDYYTPFNNLDIDTNSLQFKNAVDFARERVSTLLEIQNEIKPFYDISPRAHEMASLISQENSQLLYSQLKSEIEIAPSLDSEVVKKIVSQISSKLGIKGKDLFFPLRLALYGDVKGPNIHGIFSVLGKEEFLNRLNNVIE